MTLNLLWSDDNYSFIIADSARTHGGIPKYSHSTLGQAQRISENNITVEEGACKIIPLKGGLVLVLCGNEIDLIEFTRSFHSSLCEMNLYSLFEYINNLTGKERFTISIGLPSMIPPFMVLKYPEKELVNILRSHTFITGSLSERPMEFLREGIKLNLIESHLTISSEYRLAIGLAIATTMAVHYNLTNDHVGGAFFGAYLDKENFFWQSDILYVFYGPNFSEGVPNVLTPDFPIDFKDIDKADSRLDLITCRIRDNVLVAIFSISNRGIACWSPISETDIQVWTEKWGKELSEKLYYDADYISFIPKTPGVIAIIPNNDEYVRINNERIALSDKLVELLIDDVPINKFQLKIIQQ